MTTAEARRRRQIEQIWLGRFTLILLLILAIAQAITNGATQDSADRAKDAAAKAKPASSPSRPRCGSDSLRPRSSSSRSSRPVRSFSRSSGASTARSSSPAPYRKGVVSRAAQTRAASYRGATEPPRIPADDHDHHDYDHDAAADDHNFPR
jgi:hypothetical protein